MWRVCVVAVEGLGSTWGGCARAMTYEQAVVPVGAAWRDLQELHRLLHHNARHDGLTHDGLPHGGDRLPSVRIELRLPRGDDRLPSVGIEVRLTKGRGGTGGPEGSQMLALKRRAW